MEDLTESVVVIASALTTIPIVVLAGLNKAGILPKGSNNATAENAATTARHDERIGGVERRLGQIESDIRDMRVEIREDFRQQHRATVDSFTDLADAIRTATDYEVEADRKTTPSNNRKTRQRSSPSTE